MFIIVTDILKAKEKMKKEEQEKHIRKVTIRFTRDEFRQLEHGFNNTTSRKMSEYIRNVVLNKPVTVYTRNKSFDDFLAELILVKSELKFIGNNLNQAVKKLHQTDNAQEIKTWALQYENTRQNLLEKSVEINNKIKQILTQWSQE